MPGVTLLILLNWVLLMRPALQGGNDIERANDLRAQASQLRETREYARALQCLVDGLALRPDHPSFMYEIAQTQALLGKHDEALGWLERIAGMGIVFHPGRDSAFLGLRTHERFRAVIAEVGRNAAPVLRSEKAFTLVLECPISEGIAYDSVTNRFFVGGVRRGRILSRTLSGTESLFAAPENAWGIMGMRVDPQRRTLWVCTAAVPQMDGYTEDLEGKSALLRIHLDSGERAEAVTPGTQGKHMFGDLTVTPDGDVFVTDSRTSTVFRRDARTGTFSAYVRSEEFVSLQGVDYSPLHQALFVADYSRGVYRIDMATKVVTLLPAFPGTTLLGIDGLYVHGNSLIGIQNGISPHRVIRLELDGTGRRIESWEVLEANHPSFSEPTLGVVVGSEFHFVANSQWEKSGSRDARYDKTTVLKLFLGPDPFRP